VQVMALLICLHYLDSVKNKKRMVLIIIVLVAPLPQTALPGLTPLPSPSASP